MAKKRNRRRRASRPADAQPTHAFAGRAQPSGLGVVARATDVLFGGAEVLTVGILRLANRLVTTALTGAISVGTQAGTVAVSAVRDTITDAAQMARDISRRGQMAVQGRAPVGSRRRPVARRTEEPAASAALETRPAA